MLKKEFKVGNKIKTNKNFKIPILNKATKSLELVASKKEYTGVVASIHEDYLSIIFDGDTDFLKMKNSISGNNNFLFIPKEDVDIIEQYKNKDKKIESFVNSYCENIYFNIDSKKDKTYQLNSDLRSLQESYLSYKRSIENTIRESNLKTIELNECLTYLTTNLIDFNKIEDIYSKLFKNKKIKEVEIIERDGYSSLLITTNDLTFKDVTRDVPTYNLGAYKLLIPLKGTFNSSSILAVNYKKHWGKRYFHPCIPNSFNICLGPLGYDLSVLLEEKNYSSIIHILINFLEEPNYGKPYIDAISFACAQDVTIRPRDKTKWFDSNYWDDNECWDGERADKELKELKTKYNGNKI